MGAAMNVQVFDSARQWEQNFAGERLHQQLSKQRLRLLWIAGMYAKPALLADLTDATEAVRMIADRNFMLAGTNAASTCSAIGAEGGVVLTTTTTTNDQVLLCPHTLTSASPWATQKMGTDRAPNWETVIETGASIASITLFAGLKLTNTPVVATDADQVMFRFSTADSNTTWQVISSYNDTDTTTDTGVTVAASTKYYFRIEVSPPAYTATVGGTLVSEDRYAQCFINGTPVARVKLRDAIDLLPFAGVQTLTTAAKVVTVFGIQADRLYSAS